MLKIQSSDEEFGRSRYNEGVDGPGMFCKAEDVVAKRLVWGNESYLPWNRRPTRACIERLEWIGDSRHVDGQIMSEECPIICSKCDVDPAKIDQPSHKQSKRWPINSLYLLIDTDFCTAHHFHF